MIPSQNVNYNIPSIICYNEAYFSPSSTDHPDHWCLLFLLFYVSVIAFW